MATASIIADAALGGSRTVTANDVLTITDRNVTVVMNSSSARTFTINAGSFPAGFRSAIASIGTGTTTVMDNTTGTPVLVVTLTQNQILRLECIATNTWLTS